MASKHASTTTSGPTGSRGVTLAPIREHCIEAESNVEPQDWFNDSSKAAEEMLLPRQREIPYKVAVEWLRVRSQFPSGRLRGLPIRSTEG